MEGRSEDYVPVGTGIYRSYRYISGVKCAKEAISVNSQEYRSVMGVTVHAGAYNMYVTHRYVYSTYRCSGV